VCATNWVCGTPPAPEPPALAPTPEFEAPIAFERKKRFPRHFLQIVNLIKNKVAFERRGNEEGMIGHLLHFAAPVEDRRSSLIVNKLLSVSLSLSLSLSSILLAPVEITVPRRNCICAVRHRPFRTPKVTNPQGHEPALEGRLKYKLFALTN